MRVLYPSTKKIKEGDHIKLFDYDESLMVTIKARRIYNSFAEMLKCEDPEKIAPGYSKEKLLNLLCNFYPPEKEKLGVIVFEIVSLNK